MTMTLDSLDHDLLTALQTEVPLLRRPWAALAEKLGISESDILARVAALKGANGSKKIIRQISAIFDSKSLGYQSTLVAAKIDESRLDTAAELINRHPGVSHNYRRNHEFNLWYTLAVPPDSALGLEKTLDILHRQSGALSTRMLPTLKLFKIGVKFDLSGGSAGGDADLDARSENTGYTESHRQSADQSPLTPADKRLIRILQQDLPIEPAPFDRWAAEAGISPDDLLAAAHNFLQQKKMRRFSAVLRHREAGISANAMGVWAVPTDLAQEAFGHTAATFSAVSHCYLRKSYPDWPYTLFTMVHAPTQPQCEQVLAAISAATGITHYAALYSTKEYKKVRVKYFTGDVEEWEKNQP